jgi:hypothetical protein
MTGSFAYDSSDRRSVGCVAQVAVSAVTTLWTRVLEVSTPAVLIAAVTTHAK